MRISTPQMFQQRVQAMLDQQLRLSRTELQLATGKRMLAASDDPASALRNMQLGERLAQTSQYQKNMDTATSRLVLEESALASAGDLLQRVRELAVQSLNGTNGPSDLKGTAAEVRAHLESMLQFANSQDANGEYLFAGYQGHTLPFTHDGMGRFAYNGDQGQRHVQISPTRQIAVGDHGAGIFLGLQAADSSLTSIFEVMHDFATALETGSPSANTLTDLDAAMDRLFNARAEVGGRMRAIDNQREVNESLKLLIEQDRATLTELDYAEAITRFNQQLMAFEASQKAFAKVQGLSLFDYLG